jgi:hypothetical protein
VQPSSSIGHLALAPPPFTATVRSHFITESLRNVAVTSPTHGSPDAASARTSAHGLEVTLPFLFHYCHDPPTSRYHHHNHKPLISQPSTITNPNISQVTFRDLFKPFASGKPATNLQMRWVFDGIVPNIACVGRLLAGAGQLASASSSCDSIVSRDAAATEAMEAAAAVLAAGPLAADARALLDKTKSQQRKMEQVCGVLFSEHDGRQPETCHVTVLVDCSGSMFPHRIIRARKAVRALLTSLQPSSTFSVYLFGSMFLSYSHLLHCIIVTLCACTCIPIVLDTDAAAQGFGSPVYAATPDNISAISARVDAARSMGGTELLAAVDLVMRLEVRRSLSSFTSSLEHFGPSPPSMRYCNTFHMYPAASATTS